MLRPRTLYFRIQAVIITAQIQKRPSTGKCPIKIWNLVNDLPRGQNVQSAVIKIKRTNGSNNWRDPDEMNKKAIDGAENNTDAAGDQKRCPKVSAKLQDQSNASILGDLSDCRK